jgi:hypothetical protein
MDELEARVAALEASHADYRAVLAAVNALGANQREHSLSLARTNSDVAAIKTDLAALKTDVAASKVDFIDFRQETRANFRSVDEQFAELKVLIISFRDRPD